jgi:hypothetical protein
MHLSTYILWNAVAGIFLIMAVFMGGHVFELTTMTTWIILAIVSSIYTFAIYRQWIKISSDSIGD